MSNQDQRVISRKGARELNEQELALVKGTGNAMVHTLTACTFGVVAGAIDGDVGEC